MNFHIQLFFILLFSANNLAAQFTINGQVISDQNEPLDFVTVELLNTSDSTWLQATISDSTGFYQLENIAPGDYFLRINRLAYQSIVSDKVKVANQDIQLDFTLETEAVLAADVTVTAKRQLFVQKADRLVVNVSESVTQGNSLLEVLGKTPNVLYDRQSESLRLQGKSNVLIYIDGKPQYIESTALMSLLRNMNSADIEQIEIFSNPPAKYQAAGDAGVINIITRRRLIGKTVSFSTFAEQGRTFRTGASINYNLQNEKWNIYANYNYSKRNHQTLADLDRLVRYQGDEIILDQQLRTLEQPNHHTFQGGADYRLTDRTSIGGHLKYFYQGEQTLRTDSTFILLNDALDSIVYLQGNDASQPHRWVFNADFQHQFLDQKGSFSLELDYARRDIMRNVSYENRFLNSARKLNENTEELRLSDRAINLDVFVLRGDLTRNFSNDQKLEVGFNYTFVPLDYDIDFSDKIDGALVRNDLFTNGLTYQEQVAAAYATYHFKLGKYQFQTGLRAEQTLATSDVRDLPTNELEYLNLFPSLFISRNFNDQHQLNLSYGKRIDRPRYLSLSPVLSFSSYYLQFLGNPNLKPQYTQNVNLNYTFQPKNISFNLGFNRANGFIASVPSQNDSTRIETVQSVNVGQRDQWIASLSFPTKTLKNSSGQFNISLLNTAYSGERTDPTVNNTLLSYNINANQSFALGATWRADVVLEYFSPFYYFFIRGEKRWGVNLGISKKLWEERATLQIGVDDIFKTNKFRGHQIYQNVDIRYFTRWESQMVKMSFRMRLGDTSFKRLAPKRSGSEGAQNRL